METAALDGALPLDGHASAEEVGGGAAGALVGLGNTVGCCIGGVAGLPLPLPPPQDESTNKRASAIRFILRMFPQF
jgi:hypothetical protein